MFATAAVATALALSTFAPGAASTDASTDPEVIEVFVFNRSDLQPFEGGTYGGTCPPTHPYLFDEFYAAGRWAPHGVKVVSDTLVAAAINQKYPTPVDGADDGLKNWGGISGDYVNWETRPASLSVNMVCTSNPLKAWELR